MYYFSCMPLLVVRSPNICITTVWLNFAWHCKHSLEVLMHKMWQERILFKLVRQLEWKSWFLLSADSDKPREGGDLRSPDNNNNNNLFNKHKLQLKSRAPYKQHHTIFLNRSSGLPERNKKQMPLPGISVDKENRKWKKWKQSSTHRQTSKTQCASEAEWGWCFRQGSG